VRVKKRAHAYAVFEMQKRHLRLLYGDCAQTQRWIEILGAEVISQQDYFYKRGHYPEKQRALSSGEIGPCANARASRAGRLRQPSGLQETGDVLLANRPSGAHSQATDDPVAFKMVGFLFSICTPVMAA
jgi:hypothetical protein